MVNGYGGTGSARVRSSDQIWPCSARGLFHVKKGNGLRCIFLKRLNRIGVTLCTMAGVMGIGGWKTAWGRHTHCAFPCEKDALGSF